MHTAIMLTSLRIRVMARVTANRDMQIRAMASRATTSKVMLTRVIPVRPTASRDMQIRVIPARATAACSIRSILSSLCTTLRISMMISSSNSLT